MGKYIGYDRTHMITSILSNKKLLQHLHLQPLQSQSKVGGSLLLDLSSLHTFRVASQACGLPV